VGVGEKDSFSSLSSSPLALLASRVPICPPLALPNLQLADCSPTRCHTKPSPLACHRPKPLSNWHPQLKRHHDRDNQMNQRQVTVFHNSVHLTFCGFSWDLVTSSVNVFFSSYKIHHGDIRWVLIKHHSACPSMLAVLEPPLYAQSKLAQCSSLLPLRVAHPGDWHPAGVDPSVCGWWSCAFDDAELFV